MPQEQPVVEVSAVGRAWAVPDQVLVSLAVEARSPAVADALRDASAGVERLMTVLDHFGIPATDRRTSGLRVEPVWDPATNRENGHAASYDLQVVVRDLEAAGQLVERAAAQVGDALRVRQFALAVRDLSPHQEQARVRAVHACRAEAEQMASAAGARLGPLVRLRTGDDRTVRMEAMRASYSPGGGMPVEAGEHEVSVAVTATWQLAEEPAGS